MSRAALVTRDGHPPGRALLRHPHREITTTFPGRNPKLGNLGRKGCRAAITPCWGSAPRDGPAASSSTGGILGSSREQGAGLEDGKSQGTGNSRDPKNCS